jgi:hypothetical protein
METKGKNKRIFIRIGHESHFDVTNQLIFSPFNICPLLCIIIRFECNIGVNSCSFYNF